MRFQSNLLSIAIAGLLSPTVSATQSLDQIIISATRVEQSQQDYTGKVTVITADELQEKAIQTLPEALERIAGMPINSNGGLGSSTSVYLRGHDSKRLVLLVDGVRFNDPTNLNGASWEHLLVSDIARIEVLAGAQAGIWGGDAGAGVINVITKQAEQGTHGSLSYTLGTLGQKQTQGSVSYANQDFDVRVGYTGLSSDEFSSITPITNGVKQDPLNYEKDGYRNDTLNAKLGWNIGKEQRLEVSTFKADAKGNNDGSSPSNTHYNTYRQQTLGASYAFALSDWQLKLSAQQGDTERDFNGSVFNAEVEQQAVTANKVDSLGAWMLGADTLKQSTTRMSNASIDKGNRQTGLFVARTQKFYLPNAEQPTIINASVRNDDFSDYQSYIGKRWGVKQLLTKDAYFSINFADTRRMPNLFERFIQYDASYMAVARGDIGSLRPETVESTEVSLGWKGYSLTRFEDKVSDLIDYDFVNRNYYNRSGDSQLNGWQWKVSESLPSLSSEITLSYQVLDAKTQTGIPLARRPENSGSASITYFGLANTILSLQAQHTGARFDYYAANGTGSVPTGNFWLWHANASYQWDKAVRLFVKGVNLTDERIAQATNSYNGSTPSYYYAYSPRTVLAGIEYRF